MSLRVKVAAEAKSRYGIPDIKRWLKEEYWEKGLSTDDIAEMFEKPSGDTYSRDSVRTLMKNEGIPLKAPRGGKYFKVQLKKKGYKTSDEFFSKNTELSKAEMARKLDIHFSTLCRHYDAWMAKKING